MNDFQEELVFRLPKIRADDGTNKNLTKKRFPRRPLRRKPAPFRGDAFHIKSTVFVLRVWRKGDPIFPSKLLERRVNRKVRERVDLFVKND